MAEKDQEFWPLFWENLKAGVGKAFNWLLRYPLALVAAILVIVVGFMLIKSGVDINLGGILKWLFGKKKSQRSVVAAANTIPKNRVDANGEPIPLGTADENGWTQWEVKELKTSTNPLRDTSVIEVDGNEVQLPTGIKDSDVEEVIEVKPEVYVVKTKVNSPTHASDLLDKLPAPKGKVEYKTKGI